MQTLHKKKWEKEKPATKNYRRILKKEDEEEEATPDWMNEEWSADLFMKQQKHQMWVRRRGAWAKHIETEIRWCCVDPSGPYVVRSPFSLVLSGVLVALVSSV